MADKPKNADAELIERLTTLSIESHKLRNAYAESGVHDAAVYTALCELDTAQHCIDEKLHKLRQAIENQI